MGMKDQFREKAQQLAERGKQSGGGAKDEAPERSARPGDEAGERGGNAADRARERGQDGADQVRDQFDS
ncbi:hypothetical protein [Streptomyces sp. NBC_00388]|uniref:hypothetical protein n=1 Tax=Streptomyces sp. NBC_00388 TaxID=2975735 RepID=UPI002E1CA8A5